MESGRVLIHAQWPNAEPSQKVLRVRLDIIRIRACFTLTKLTISYCRLSAFCKIPQPCLKTICTIYAEPSKVVLLCCFCCFFQQELIAEKHLIEGGTRPGLVARFFSLFCWRVVARNGSRILAEV